VTPDGDGHALKEAAQATIDALADDLVAASHDIHARPELGYEEHFASSRLADLLEAHGLTVEREAYGLETAFVAQAGDRGAHVVICCEYDALPGVGHGCGHNIIGTAGAGAGLALAALAAEAGGRVTVLGTPAEEQSGGGKIRLLDAGAFAEADVAMMVHPEAGDVAWLPYLANDTLVVEMHGRAAHASASPWLGINALDALVLGYQAVTTLRLHLREDEKVYGIITDGGQSDNVITELAAGRWRVRARNEERLALLKERVVACFEGAARQTGARLEHRFTGGYADMTSNRALALAYQRNGEALGRSFVDPRRIPHSVAGSTDMGNVSKVVPSIHPIIGMCPVGTPGHSVEMAEHAVSPAADQAVTDGAKALAMTGLDVWLDPELLGAIRTEFEDGTRSAP
jgi:amidohydrolase